MALGLIKKTTVSSPPWHTLLPGSLDIAPKLMLLCAIPFAFNTNLALGEVSGPTKLPKAEFNCHTIILATPLSVAFKNNVSLAQTVWSGPALIIEAGSMVTTIESMAEGQAPAGSAEVNIKVTALAAVSAALNV